MRFCLSLITVLILCTSPQPTRAAAGDAAGADLDARIDKLKAARIAIESDNNARADKVKTLRAARDAKRSADLTKAKADIAANEAALKDAEQVIHYHTTECEVVQLRRANKDAGNTTEHDKL